MCSNYFIVISIQKMQSFITIIHMDFHQKLCIFKLAFRYIKLMQFINFYLKFNYLKFIALQMAIFFSCN